MSGESIRNTISLMIITLIAGLLLGVVYEITKEPIAQEKERSLQEAYQTVFPDADTFSKMEFDAKQAQKLMDENGYDATIEEVMQALDGSGNLLGYALKVTDHEGYGGDISLAMGVGLDGTIYRLSFLSISETAGLGMKATEEEFYGQFEGKQAEKLTYTKSGAKEEDEIDAISGATVTTNAVTNGVNAGLCYFHTLEQEATQ